MNGATHAADVVDIAARTAYYEKAVFEHSFASLCKMTLPNDLAGKTVLDIGCRRGKGVVKLADRVGEGGRVIGIDWTASFINEARRLIIQTQRSGALVEGAVELYVAHPEDLRMANLVDESVDMVFANCSLHLAYCPEMTYREIFRVLKPGGLLVNETVLADGKRDACVVQWARALGNGIQAAPAQEDIEALLRALGFALPQYFEMHEVSAADDAQRGQTAPTAPSSEQLCFYACVMHVYKPA